MNLPCDIVGDMLVLYEDDALSDESRAAVDEHLKTCTSCREHLESIRREREEARHFDEMEKKSRDYQMRVKKKIKKIVITTVCVLILLGWWMFTSVTTNNPNIFETTGAYFQLYVLGKGHVVVKNDPFTIYCEARQEIGGTVVLLGDYGFENTHVMDDLKRIIMIKDNELYYADVYDNRFIAHATVTKADIPPETQAVMIERFRNKQSEVSTGE